MTMSTASEKIARELDAKAVSELRSRLRGRLILPQDADYDESRTVWNGMINRRPAAIARCLGTADVIAGVNFAREQGVPLAIKGGGHNIAGLAVADDALVLDMSLMRGVWVDSAQRIVHAQAGCLLGDVDRETQLQGLAAPLGFVSTTGIAGLTLGGGFGYLTRRFGWTCDNVTGFDVVTVEGKLVRASETENPDLFWALGGGGGNFGVVTSFDYKLYELGPTIMAGGIAWPAEDAPAVFELFTEVTASAPPELTCVLALRKAPPAPWLAPAIHGKDIVAMFVCHSGDLAEGERLVQKIKRFGSPVGDIIQPRPYTSQQSLLDGTQPAGRRSYWKSDYLSEITPELLVATAKQAAMIKSPHSAILSFPLDGALNRLPEDHSPASNRNTTAVFNIAAQWERPEDDAANIGWAKDAFQDLRRFSSGGTYINFLTEEETADRTAAAYGSHLGRLAEIKAHWDPNNLLRINRNVAPKGSAG